jgi:hypothetical protein
MPRWAAALLLAAAAWAIGTHFMHVFSEAINWDEFALLARADVTYRFGQVVGSGRPGFVSLLLIPFVMNCADSVITAVHARLLWQFITLAYLVGVYFLVRRWFIYAGRPDEGRVQGMLAVALLAFLPAFVTWSVQVRTDQAALAAATLGGVALLSRSYWQAAVAGALFAIGLLCSQKAAYVVALVGIMYATGSVAMIWVGGKKKHTRELRHALGRLALACVITVSVIALYLVFVPGSAALMTSGKIASAIDTMNWVREQQGYRAYTVNAHRLVVHWALLATLIAWSIRAITRRDGAEFLLLTTCWSALALGLLVVRFHGSTFPYFIMTTGLFPAVSFGMIVGGPLTLCGRLRWIVLVALVWFAALQSAHESLEMLDDTQHEQRETMRLADALAGHGRRGYNVEGALFCSRDPAPIPAMFSQQIWRRFSGSPTAATEFITDFRRRPIAFFVESYRMNQFPPAVRNFFAEHYVWYARSLFIAGFEIDAANDGQDVDVIVAGSYRWEPDPGLPAGTLRVGAVTLRPFEAVDLEVGTHRVSAGPVPAVGSLVLADLPATRPDGYPAFYHLRQILQLGGSR